MGESFVKHKLWMIVLGLGLAGCSGEPKGTADGSADKGSTDPKGTKQPEPVADAEPPENKANAKDWEPAAGTASISGTVKFSGTPPKRRPIDISGKKECSELHKEPVLSENVIVAADGSLKNAFVYVKRGLGAWKFAAPTAPALVDQKGCLFGPHIQGVMVNQPIKITNNDPFAHNVHSFANFNSTFNFSQNQGAEDIKTFTKTEMMVKIKCDVHGWMETYICVLDHPYFVVTGDDGKFELQNLPPGDYTIECRHEVFGTKKVQVKVGDKEAGKAEFTFSR